MGIWDSATNNDIALLEKDIFDKKRNKKECHFIFKQSDGSTIEAVTRIQNEQTLNKNININRVLAISAIIISIGIPIILYLLESKTPG